jgi:hypothetical protein
MPSGFTDLSVPARSRDRELVGKIHQVARTFHRLAGRAFLRDERRPDHHRSDSALGVSPITRFSGSWSGAFQRRRSSFPVSLRRAGRIVSLRAGYNLPLVQRSIDRQRPSFLKKASHAAAQTSLYHRLGGYDSWSATRASGWQTPLGRFVKNDDAGERSRRTVR